MRRSIVHFFEDLGAGDPVALTVAGVIAVIAIALLLFWAKIAWSLRKEDEQRKQRYRRKDPNSGREKK
jgi:hypothetical protein